MRVEHFGGTVLVDTLDALDAVLRQRFGDDANELWLSHDASHPCLAILVHGDDCCLHYFPHEGHPGFQSAGAASSEWRTFFVSTPSEAIELSADAVVSFTQARAAAAEFYADGSLPTSVRWLEL